jgi:hypothetical protein
MSYLQELSWYAVGAKHGCTMIDLGVRFACVTPSSCFMFTDREGALLEDLVAEIGGIDLIDVSGLSSLLIAGFGMLEYYTMRGLLRQTYGLEEIL